MSSPSIFINWVNQRPWTLGSGYETRRAQGWSGDSLLITSRRKKDLEAMSDVTRCQGPSSWWSIFKHDQFQIHHKRFIYRYFLVGRELISIEYFSLRCCHLARSRGGVARDWCGSARYEAGGGATVTLAGCGPTESSHQRWGLGKFQSLYENIRFKVNPY